MAQLEHIEAIVWLYRVGTVAIWSSKPICSTSSPAALSKPEITTVMPRTALPRRTATSPEPATFFGPS